jgi:hypothetical protein
VLSLIRSGPVPKKQFIGGLLIGDETIEYFPQPSQRLILYLFGVTTVLAARPSVFDSICNGLGGLPRLAFKSTLMMVHLELSFGNLRLISEEVEGVLKLVSPTVLMTLLKKVFVSSHSCTKPLGNN